MNSNSDIESDRAGRFRLDVLRLTMESMDEGVLTLGADNRVLFFNQKLFDLLGLDRSVLHEGASIDDIRRVMRERGEYDRADPVSAAWGRTGALELEPTVSERRRPNGTLLEIRAMPLPDGGVVRTFTDITKRRALEEAADLHRERFRLLAENTGDAIIWCALDSTRRYVSPASLAILGYAPEELVGTKPLSFIHPDDAAAFAAILDDLANGRREQITSRQRYRHKRGHHLWIEVSFKLIRDGDGGTATGWVAALRDISGRVVAEEALRASEQRLALALRSGGDGLWDYDLRTDRLTFSGRWVELLGYDPALANSTTRAQWRELTHPEDAARAQEAFIDHVTGRTPTLDFDYRVRCRDGGYVWCLVRGRVVEWDSTGAPVRLIGSNTDVTARKEAEALVAHMALHDALTGLPNRILFQQSLDEAIAAHERDGRGFALIACDLDRFKAVNDTYGHSAGDALLRDLSQRLRLAIGAGGLVARLGGDEFAIILHGEVDQRHVEEIACRIVATVTQSFHIGTREVGVGISLGIVIQTPGLAPVDAEEAQRNADVAMYAAKADGANSFRVFEPGMRDAATTRDLLERDLRDALTRRAFALEFQPIVVLADGSVEAFEALLRWDHPSRGRIGPADFIPLAEEVGLIVPLGEWVLGEACRRAASWPGRTAVAVNVSAVQFRQPGRLLAAVVAALKASGLPPARLELEITESVFMADAEEAIGCLHALHALGLRISLDDFGTGYSSLAYLRRFPFDKIKFDRAFIADIGDPWTAAIVRAVVELAARVDADVVAEGIETRGELSLVRSLGCSQAQGFLFGRPTSLKEPSERMAIPSPAA